MHIIFSEISILSGVYIIKCLINNHIYIGSTENLYSKFKDYEIQLKNAKHRVKELNEDIRKYGIDNIELEVVCTCTLKVARIIERYYIKKYNAISLGYNKINATNNLLTDTGSIVGNTPGGRKLLHLNKTLERFILDLFDYRYSEINQVISIMNLIDLFENEFKVDISDDIAIIFEILRKLDITTFVKDMTTNVYYEISGNQMWKFACWYDFNSDVEIDSMLKKDLCRKSNLNYMFVECPNYIGKNDIDIKNMLQSINSFRDNNEIIDATYKAQYHKVDYLEYGFGDK